MHRIVIIIIIIHHHRRRRRRRRRRCHPTQQLFTTFSGLLSVLRCGLISEILPVRCMLSEPAVGSRTPGIVCWLDGQACGCCRKSSGAEFCLQLLLLYYFTIVELRPCVYLRENNT